MPRFLYTARAAGSAASTAGTLDAFSRREALHLLQARGLQVVQLDEEGAAIRPIAGASQPVQVKRLTTKQRLPFLEALVDLVNAGLSAGEAVRLLAVRLQEPKLKALCAALWARLGEGSTLSVAMGEHSNVFDRQTVNLIAAGEATGNLKEVLARLIQHFTEQRDLRQKFAATLAYPAFICFLGGGVVLFLLFFLVPRLQTLLGSLGGHLPFATRLLVNGSHFLLYVGPFLAIGLVIVVMFFLRWRLTPDGQRQSDAWLVRLPVVRDFVIQAAILNFTHTLAVLIENGVTTAEALRLTERAVDNTKVQEILHEATDRVIEGSILACVAAAHAPDPAALPRPPRRRRADRQPRAQPAADREVLPGRPHAPPEQRHAPGVWHCPLPDLRLRRLPRLRDRHRALPGQLELPAVRAPWLPNATRPAYSSSTHGPVIRHNRYRPCLFSVFPVTPHLRRMRSPPNCSPVFLPVTSSDLLSAGIYTVPEASRLTRVTSSRIRRWMKGYDFKTKKERHHSNPVWSSQLAAIDDKMAVGFKDLMEIRFVNAFLNEGVSWKTMRDAHISAKAKLGTDHPFCTHKFATDGREILLHQAQASGDTHLIDITNDQREFARIVAPFLKELDFDHGVTRWWPLGKKRSVVVDPVRNMGQPTVTRFGSAHARPRQQRQSQGRLNPSPIGFEVAPRGVTPFIRETLAA